jgi:hypothetical protein
VQDCEALTIFGRYPRAQTQTDRHTTMPRAGGARGHLCCVQRVT